MRAARTAKHIRQVWTGLAAACGLASGVVLAQQPPQQQLPPPGMAERVAACTACHGAEGRAAPDGYYPRLAGKPETYLLNQLQNFRDGRRRYPPMNYLLANLSDDYLRQIARYFAEQHPPYPPPPADAVSPALLERGRLLVTQGQQSTRQIPACTACHGAALAGVQPAIPGLLGLPRDYINAQLGAWKNGVRRTRAPDCMASIAQQLTPEDIEAASTWLSRQPADSNARPATAPVQPLPLVCGSMPEVSGAAP